MPDTQPDFSADLTAVGKQYPALSPYLGNVKVQYGTPQPDAPPGGQLEFYPPWEGRNPNPGATTLELYKNQQPGPDLQRAIAGDMMHLLGSVDPRTGQPIDPQWANYRQQLLDARTDKHRAIDLQAYQQEGDKRPFDDWMNQSRADAYVRGYITPDQASEWKDVYTPEMKKVLDQMKGYLTTPPIHTLFSSPQPESPVIELLRKQGQPQ